jgi:hypothetical protein
MAGDPKRHHQVPQFYLERWAANGKVAVRWRDGKEYETSPKIVAVESGFYDIPPEPPEVDAAFSLVSVAVRDDGHADRRVRRRDDATGGRRILSTAAQPQLVDRV